MSEFAVSKIEARPVKALMAAIAAFVLGTVLLVSIALAAGWGSNGDDSPTQPRRTTVEQSDTLLNCRIGQPC